MITTFQVSWFKPFSELTLPRLARITIIGGKNNAGKSSLLESIFLYLDRTNPEFLLRSLGWRGFSALTGDSRKLFEHAFHDFDTSRPIALVATVNERRVGVDIRYVEHDRVRSVSLKEAQDKSSENLQSPRTNRPNAGGVIEIRTWDPQTGEGSGEGTLVVRNGELRLEGDLDRHGLPHAQYQSLRVRTSASEDAERLGKLGVQRQIRPAVDFLRKAFPEVRDLICVPSGAEQGAMIYADVGLPKLIPLPALGDGACRLLSYYLAASTLRPGGVLLLDEVGAGLHHSIMPILWDRLSDIVDLFQCQIVAATHSYECLAGIVRAQDRLFDDFVYYRLDQSPRSREVRAVEYSFAELSAAIEHEWEVR